MRTTAKMQAALLGAMLLVGSGAVAGPATANEGNMPVPAARQAQAGTTVVAGPSTAEELARQPRLVPQGSRNPNLTMNGAEAKLTLEWNRGRNGGKFDTRVYGSVKDTDDDGRCARVDMWSDGRVRTDITKGKGQACPRDNVQPVTGKADAWRVMVRLCTRDLKTGDDNCTGWS